MNIHEKVLQSLRWKKSANRSAEKLGISVDEYLRIKKEIRESQEEEEQAEENLFELAKYGYAGYTEDLEKGIAEHKIESSFQPKTAAEIEELIKLDKTKWKLIRYSVWNSGKEDTWLTSARVAAITSTTDSIGNFQKFLETYCPEVTLIHNIHKQEKKSGCLIINKQDAHLNKYDINGQNDIIDRFNNVLEKTKVILEQSIIHSHLEKIIYIIGSDIIDSEWTETTTKGTPQKSVLPYQIAFSIICNHEVSMINLLLQYADTIEIPFVPGNHDEYVGWHLVSWLKSYFKDQSNLNIDISTDYSKYIRFHNSAFMLNHGDAMKPEKLAQVFPIEFKNEWSNCEYFTILTGDKHHEITRDIGGIRFYQVPAWSKSCSKWDSKHGWNTAKAEIQGLFVSKDKGITNIYKEIL
jgi:hypothetical protein